MSSDQFIEEDCLSLAWGRATMKLFNQKRVSEVIPIVVSITGFSNGVVHENQIIRNSLDRYLTDNKLQKVSTVASTIFPVSLWNPKESRCQLYRRYNNVYPRLKKISKKNRRGIYFHRMISWGDEEKKNQLEFIIKNYRLGKRKSFFQVSIFDPRKDHSTQAQLGFPCLQHIAFSPSEGKLSVNAFYATQYMVERAYGNYLGICNLGRFVASELKLDLVRVTCYTGFGKLVKSKKSLKDLMSIIDKEAT